MGGFELVRGEVVEATVQAPAVVPVDPASGGQLAAGATTLGIGLGIGSVVSGGIAASLDGRPCLQQGDTAACVGLGFGAVGTALGPAATGGSVLAAAGIIGETSTANGVLAGLGAFGLNVGVADRVVDAVNLFAASGDACHR